MSLFSRDALARVFLFGVLQAVVLAGHADGAVTTWSTTSPNGRNVLTLRLGADGDLSYTVRNDRRTIVLSSPLGVICADGDFSRQLAFASDSDETSDRQRYTLFAGPVSAVDNELRRRTLTFRIPDGRLIHVDCAASDEGVAFRYRLPADPSGRREVLRERTAFVIPKAARGWVTPYHAAGEHTPNNEDYYFHVAVGEPPPDSRATARGWGMPALFGRMRGGPSLLVCESGAVGDYCQCHLVNDASSNAYQIAFAHDDETHQAGKVEFDTLPSSEGPWALPWRVLIIGDPGAIMESTLVTDLAPSSKINDTSWIAPGRASWGWLSQPEGPYNLEFFNKYTELAADYGWEYTTFDGGWWDVDLTEISRYATDRGVRPLAWMYSGDCYDTKRRRAKLDELKSCGVAGVKIDFWASQLPTAMETLRETLRDAADREMVVLLHGCPTPQGWQRTWPNLLACEAVLGLEGYLYDEHYPERVAELNCVLPFTRNVVGPMDVTPVRIRPLGPRRLTTAAHELATALVHSSGVVHYADSPEGYAALPEAAKRVLRDAPLSWDETRCLIGEPGRVVVVARRSGKRWFVAGINGQDVEARIVVDLSSLCLADISLAALSEGADPAFDIATSKISSASKWQHTIPPRGGFVLTPLSPKKSGS